MRFAWVGMLAALSTANLFAGPPDDEIVVRPESAPGPLDNPLKGWCPYPDAGPIRQPYSMVFLYASWKDLEPERGPLRLRSLGGDAWSVARGQGQARRPPDLRRLPVEALGPARLAQAGASRRPPYNDHGGGLSPDYDDPRMVEAMERLIAAMGRRYDGDPRVGFIELGPARLLGRVAHLAAGQALRQPGDRAAGHRGLPAGLPAQDPPRPDRQRDFAGGSPGSASTTTCSPRTPTTARTGRSWRACGRRAGPRTGSGRRSAARWSRTRPSRGSGEGYRADRRDGRARPLLLGRAVLPALERSSTPEFRERSEALVRRMGYQFRLTEVRHPARSRRGHRVDHDPG